MRDFACDLTLGSQVFPRLLLTCFFSFIHPYCTIHVQYSVIMRFLVRHNRHHKVSRSSYVTKLLLFCEELGLGGHFVMPIQCTRNLIMRVYWTTLYCTATILNLKRGLTGVNNALVCILKICDSLCFCLSLEKLL